MVLKASWGSFGLILGVLRGFLGASLGLHNVPKPLTIIDRATCWALIGLFCLLLVAEDGLKRLSELSWVPRWCSWKPLGGDAGALQNGVEPPN